MRRKGILVGAIVIFALLSAVLAGQHTGRGYCCWRHREPIYIYGNDSFTFKNGVIAGCGTAQDPFVIQGWYIDNPPTDYGIYLDHTTAYVVIRDCVVERAQAAGIYFNSVVNARVEASKLNLNTTGVYFLNSRYNIVEDTVITRNHYGAVMGPSSRNNCITGNSFIENGLNGLDPEHRNQWHCYGIGNYWSDYDGADFNQDGVGDRPYFRLADCYPLVCPPAATTANIPSVVVAPEPEPVLETVPESTPPAAEPEAQPEPEPLVEPLPEYEPPLVQTPSAVITPEPEPEPKLVPEPEPEAPQTAPPSNTE